MSLSRLIYEETMRFLEVSGLIGRLQESLCAETIDDRMDRIDISSAGLETLDAVHCVVDRGRTLAFMEAIEKTVQPGEVVVEAGAGAGVLAVLAAALGAEVYGIEINAQSLGLARGLAEWFTLHGLVRMDDIVLVQGDASLWVPPKRIDLLISENIYTGMFYEMQIPITCHLAQFLSPSGRIIPRSMESYLILAESRLPSGSKHGQMISPSIAEERFYETRELSKPTLYDKIIFNGNDDTLCQVRLEIPVLEEGLVNSLLIYSEVTVAENIVLGREDVIFFCEDALISINPPVRVRVGSVVDLEMSYRRGSKPEDGMYILRSWDLN